MRDDTYLLSRRPPDNSSHSICTICSNRSTAQIARTVGRGRHALRPGVVFSFSTYPITAPARDNSSRPARRYLAANEIRSLDRGEIVRDHAREERKRSRSLRNVGMLVVFMFRGAISRYEITRRELTCRNSDLFISTIKSFKYRMHAMDMCT